MPSKWSTQFSDEQKDQLLDTLEGVYEKSDVIKEEIEKHFNFTDPQLARSREHKAQVDELRQQITSMEAKQAEKEIRQRIDSEKSQAQARYKLSDEEMKDVSKLMLESGIGNYDKAADYYRLSKQAAVPTSDKAREHSALTLPGDIELFKDRVGWARKEAYKAINEIERNRAA